MTKFRKWLIDKLGGYTEPITVKPEIKEIKPLQTYKVSRSVSGIDMSVPEYLILKELRDRMARDILPYICRLEKSKSPQGNFLTYTLYLQAVDICDKYDNKGE